MEGVQRVIWVRTEMGIRDVVSYNASHSANQMWR